MGTFAVCLKDLVAGRPWNQMKKEAKILFEKKDGEKKFIFSKLQYRLSFMVVDGAHSIKWTSRKSNGMLIKVE